jgi:hypothetical protein
MTSIGDGVVATNGLGAAHLHPRMHHIRNPEIRSSYTRLFLMMSVYVVWNKS